MSPRLSAFHLSAWLLLGLAPVFLCVDITAEPGENVTLPCLIHKTYPIIFVEWRRPEMKPDFVLMYRHNQYGRDGQLQPYVNRVELKDRKMKGGDLSMILKNVTISDSGIYETEILQTVPYRTLKVVCTVNLSVHQPGEGAVTMTPMNTVAPTGVTPGEGAGTMTPTNTVAPTVVTPGEGAGTMTPTNTVAPTVVTPGEVDGGSENAGKKDGGDECGHVGLTVSVTINIVLVVGGVLGFVMYKTWKQLRKRSHDLDNPPVMLTTFTFSNPVYEEEETAF